MSGGKDMAIMIIYIVFYPIMYYVGAQKGIKFHNKEVGVIWKLYPKSYIIPSKLMRKQFKLEKKEMLKFYYYQLYVVNGCIITSFLYVLLFVLSDFNISLAFDLVLIFSLVMIINIIFIETKTVIYKKMKKDKCKG